MECTQFTYFQQVGGIDLDPPSVELTYGTERLAMYLQGVDNVFDLEWVPGRHLRRRVQGQRGPVVGLQLRAGRHRAAAAVTSPTTSASASAAWSAGLARPGLRLRAQDLAHVQPARRPRRHQRDRAHRLHRPGAQPGPQGGRGLRGPAGRSGRPPAGDAGRRRRAARRRRPGAAGRRGRRGVDLAARSRDGPRLPARDRRGGDAGLGLPGRPSTCCPTGWPGCSRPRASTSRREDVEVMVSPRRIAVLIAGRARRAGAARDRPARPGRRGGLRRRRQARPRPARASPGPRASRPTDLEVREEAGRRFVYYVTRSESRPTAELLPDICLKIVRDMYFPKNMRWGYRDLRFSRPIRWLVALWGDDGDPLRHRRADLGPDEPGTPLAGRAGARSPGRATTWRPCGRSRVVVDHRERERLIWAELERVAGRAGPGGRSTRTARWTRCCSWWSGPRWLQGLFAAPSSGACPPRCW